MMGKRIIRTEIGQDRIFDIQFPPQHPEHTPIDELLIWLNDVKSKGATHIEWDVDTDEAEEVSAQAIRLVEETDAEFEKRQAKDIADKLAKQQEEAALRLSREKQLYQELKAKFEPTK